MSKIQGCFYFSKDPQRRLIISPSNQWTRNGVVSRTQHQEGDALPTSRCLIGCCVRQTWRPRNGLVDVLVNQNQEKNNVIDKLLLFIKNMDIVMILCLKTLKIAIVLIVMWCLNHNAFSMQVFWFFCFVFTEPQICILSTKKKCRRKNISKH